MISIILADDREIIRMSLVSLLSGISYLKICGQCSNFYQIIKGVEVMRPDVLMMNVSMPGLNINNAIEEINKFSPETSIIIMCLSEEEVNTRQTTDSRIHRYITKSSTAQDLIDAIKSSPRQKGFTRETQLQSSINYTQTFDQIKLGDVYKSQLTPREEQVLKLIGEGNQSKTIACKLGISAATVKTHKNNLMEKLGVRNIAGLTREAIRLKLISSG